MDTQMINDLINVLDKEAKLYDDILKISRNKTNIIVEGKVAELEKIVKLEQSLVLQMAKLEDDRERLIEKVSKLVGLAPGEITITKLINLVDRSQAEALRASQESMVSIVRELSNSNELNSKLIKNSLDYINFSLNLFAGAGNTGNNYDPSGEKADAKSKNFFDFKV